MNRLFTIVFCVFLLFSFFAGCDSIDDSKTPSISVADGYNQSTDNIQTPENSTNPPGGSGPSKPTDPTETEVIPDNISDPTEPVPPTETAPEASEPSASEPTQTDVITYLDYYEMSAEDQQAFINSFDSIDAFFAWLTVAQQEYEEGRTPIDGSASLLP